MTDKETINIPAEDPKINKKSSSVNNYKKHYNKLLFGIIIVLILIIVFLLMWVLFFNKNNISNAQTSYLNPSIMKDPDSNNNLKDKPFDTLQEESKSTEQVLKDAKLADNIRKFNGKFSVSDGFSAIVDYALPAVVNVSAYKTVETPQFSLPDNAINPFLKELFKQFAMPTKKEKAISLGSGFIVRSDGFVVTNYHVINGAKNVKITLHDGKTFGAEVYAVDVMTDLAVLKMNATNLPTLQFGDSSKSKVGDWVIAIGNPFGLGGTVSAGIISARGRDINIGMYDEFIQTDAAINRGNSGGPMINTSGQIIGVNTAIFSTTGGGSIGIGFAVPSDSVKNIVAQLITNKKVVRGWIGVQIQDLNDSMAKALNLPNKEGSLVAAVTSGGPAEKAGLKVGDVITSANNNKIINKKILPKMVSVLRPGAVLNLTVVSSGVEKNVIVNVASFPYSLENELADKQENKSGSKLDSYSLKEETFSKLGFKVAEINSQARKMFSLSKDAEGVLITAVEEGSLAEENGLRSGLIISSVNGRKITNISTLKGILNNNSQSDFIVLLVDPVSSNQFFVSLSRNSQSSEE